MLLNCDLAETDQIKSDGAEHLAMAHIDMANIACGFHAGNRQVAKDTITLAKSHSVTVGAHPSYPDRENFGRISMALNKADISDLVYQQISLIDALCDELDHPMTYIKPHGALYHDMMHSDEVLFGIFQAVKNLNPALKVMVMATADNSIVARKAEPFGIELIFEAFADRRYNSQGYLAPRSNDNAIISDEAELLQQAIAFTKGETINSIDGKPLLIKANSLCVHGDNPQAIASIQALRQALLTNQNQ